MAGGGALLPFGSDAGQLHAMLSLRVRVTDAQGAFAEAAASVQVCAIAFCLPVLRLSWLTSMLSVFTTFVVCLPCVGASVGQRHQRRQLHDRLANLVSAQLAVGPVRVSAPRFSIRW